MSANATPAEPAEARREVVSPEGLSELGFLSHATNVEESVLAMPSLDARLECGMAGARPLGEESNLLDGRLRIRGVQGAIAEQITGRLMGEPDPPVEYPLDTWRLYLAAHGEKVVVTASELYALAGNDFVAMVREHARRAFPQANHRIERGPDLPDGLEALQVVPDELDTSDEAVFTYGLYVVSPNRSVQLLTFYLNPSAATDREACIQLAMRSAQTLRLGDAELDSRAQTWRLTIWGSSQLIRLTLPAGFVVTTRRPADLHMHHVRHIGLFGQPATSEGFLVVGGHPSRDDAGPNFLEWQRPLLGETTTWLHWNDGTAHGEAMVRLDDEHSVYATVEAPDEDALATLLEAFGSASVE